jgi:FkbM family methyltransferase
MNFIKLIKLLARKIEYKVKRIFSLFLSIFIFKNWFTFLKDCIGIDKECLQYQLRNGLKINLVKREKNDLTTFLLLDVFVNKDYGKIGNNLTIVDIGANIGAFSIYSVYNNENRCFAYEPELSNFLKLEENIKLNNLSDRIKAFNFAVSDSCEDMKLYKFESIAHSTTRKGDNFDIVHCIDLRSIIEHNEIKKIDYLKIDCEGAEFDIFYGTSREVFDKIEYLCFEYHNYSEKENYNGVYLIEYMERNGFKIIEHKIVTPGLLGIVKAVNTKYL